jgi:hypothetical protein
MISLHFSTRYADCIAIIDSIVQILAHLSQIFMIRNQRLICTLLAYTHIYGDCHQSSLFLLCQSEHMSDLRMALEPLRHTHR